MNDPREEFNRYLGDRVLRDITRMLFEANSTAYRHAAPFEDAERHDVLPHIRRAYVEQGLRHVADRHGIEARAVHNVAKNSYHTELVAGPVLLTAAQLDRPDRVVRDARYRNTLAEHAQCSFFDVPAPSPGATLYGVLIWGYHRQVPTAPSFAHIQFPARDFKYVGAGLDLFRQYPNVVSMYMPKPKKQPGTATNQHKA